MVTFVFVFFSPLLLFVGGGVVMVAGGAGRRGWGWGWGAGGCLKRHGGSTTFVNLMLQAWVYSLKDSMGKSGGH